MKKYIYLILLFGTLMQSLQAQALELVLSNKNLDRGQALKAQALIDKVMEVLPPKIKEGLNYKIPVSFEVFGKNDFKIACTQEENNGSSKGQTLGLLNQKFFSQKFKIKINRGFLSADFSESIDCLHKSVGKVAIATILHEVGHLYDLENIRDEKTKKWAEECNLNDFNASEQEKSECNNYREFLYTFSSEPHFRALTYWQDGMFKSKLINQKQIRTPDAYEFSKPQESLAVNFEYFLLDEEYGCRRPGLYHYFQKKLDHDPYPLKNCNASSEIELTTNYNNRIISIKHDLDPARVYQIQYLLAGKGSAMMSRWGHAMFKIVLCAPERKTVGPECLQDKSYHIVAGFRARIDTARISSVKGVLGGYPSQIFLQSYLDIYDEYARGEFRTLHALPLRFSEKEKELFIWQVLETYWTYEGSYAFLSNNCADEALQLIKKVTDNDKILHSKVTTPLGLVDIFANAKLIKDANYESPDVTVASELGILTSAFLNIAPYIMSERMIKSPAQVDVQLKKYIKETTADQRMGIYQEILQNNPESKIIAAFLMIEQNFIAPHFMKKLTGQLEAAKARYIKLKKNDTAIDNRQVAGFSYGIPLVEELKGQISAAELLNAKLQEWNDHNQELIENLREDLRPSLLEAEKIKSNREVMFKDYKKLKLVKK